MSDEETLERISTRVAFFETSLVQLKKDIPKYIKSQADSKQSHSHLPKGLKAVASSEPHSALQYFLFLFAKKQEELAKQHEKYHELERECRELLDSWDKLLIAPMKTILQDSSSSGKRKKPIKQPSFTVTTPIPPTPNFPSSSNQPAGGDPTRVIDQTVAPAPDPLTPVILPHTGEILDAILPIHAKLFEKHRVRNMKQLFQDILWREMSYHAKSLEAYSQLMECLSAVDDSEYHDQTAEVQTR